MKQKKIHHEPSSSQLQLPSALNASSDDQQQQQHQQQQRTSLAHHDRRSNLLKNQTQSKQQSTLFLSSDEKKEDLIHFEQLIRNLIESEHLDHFQEYKKQIFHNLNIVTDEIFLLNEHILEKLSLLALSGSRNTQSVYADALKCSLILPTHMTILRKQKDQTITENKFKFFLEPTGRRLLIRLIDAFWSKSKSNDFCDEALDVISSDLFDLIRESSLSVSSLSLSHTLLCRIRLIDEDHGADDHQMDYSHHLSSYHKLHLFLSTLHLRNTALPLRTHLVSSTSPSPRC
jgi:hypothetical protein